MKTERIIAIDNILIEMENNFRTKGIKQEEMEKYLTYGTLAMLGLFSQQGIDVEEGIELITNMLQGNKKGGSNYGKGI
ncbi:hypothetical protein CO47_0125 [Enterococcus phage AUEF3]|jgi:hypothetical protein|uniref:Uncharacterized protein n=1 Tax=Enterococcus phage AUEF3 TaxID=1476978 RepID=X2KS04_9CAUD|nr:hypothetical protein FDJ59_gp30 [Enterococcus phage AUEF3]AHN83296.1 hypothetical protein CO47_0125 [Enterococcus phage AUEF3]